MCLCVVISVTVVVDLEGDVGFFADGAGFGARGQGVNVARVVAFSLYLGDCFNPIGVLA